MLSSSPLVQTLTRAMRELVATKGTLVLFKAHAMSSIMGFYLFFGYYFIYCFSLSLFPHCFPYGMQNPLHQPCWLAFQAQLSQINLSDCKSFLRPHPTCICTRKICFTLSLSLPGIQHSYDTILCINHVKIQYYLTLDHHWWRACVRCTLKIYTHAVQKWSQVSFF